MNDADRSTNCTYGVHVQVEDGLTIDGVRLWHCTRCGAGVRRACQPVEIRPRLDWCWVRPFFWLPFAIICTLILLLSFCAKTNASEIPTWALRGIAACETGTHWTDIGELDRDTWPRSTTGAVSPWHISLDVLTDLGVRAKADRIHKDPVLAESYVRQQLLRLYAATGDWRQSVAAWRAGLGNRHLPFAKDYAQRAFNYGTTY